MADEVDIHTRDYTDPFILHGQWHGCRWLRNELGHRQLRYIPEIPAEYREG